MAKQSYVLVNGEWVATGGAPGAPGKGVAPGGAPGQVLTKKGGADYDTEWTSLSDEGDGGVAVFKGDVDAGSSVTVQHDLHTADVTVQVYRKSDGSEVKVAVEHSGSDRVTLHFATAVMAGEYRAVVMGQSALQRDVRQFGAVGNGITDDQAAIQLALNSLNSGDTLVFPSGLTFLHSDVLKVTVPGVTLNGGGTIQATTQGRSAIWVDGVNYVTVENLNITNSASDHRWAEWEQVGLLLKDTNGSAINYVRVARSSAAGIQIENASNFRVTHVLCEDTWSDSVHITGGSHHGYLADLEVRRCGDDGVACISYRTSLPNSDILVERAQVYDQNWGRAFSVVGGERITYREIYTEGSAGAAIYLASEGNYDTHGVDTILVEGAEIVDANSLAPEPDHGAVLIYNGHPEEVLTNITMKDVWITNTDAAASRQIGIIQDDPAFTISRVQFEDFVVNGGTATTLYANTASSVYNIINAKVDGVTQPDWIGWT